VLEVRDLHVSYGEIRAVARRLFEVRQGEIVTLLGSNGAGKTTTLRALSGLLHPREGDILFQVSRSSASPLMPSCTGASTHVPEGRRIFNRLTVLENLEMGAFTRADAGVRETWTVSSRSSPAPGAAQPVAGTLSGGEQQMKLAIGRGPHGPPTLLLLDEPPWAWPPSSWSRSSRPSSHNKQGPHTRDQSERAA